MFAPPGKTAKDDVKSVIKFFRLRQGFSKQVLDEAEAVDRKVSAKGRLDLRRKFIFTCDPQSARDFDDALSLETDRKGNRILGVHIADVSHYVRPGSAIDKEAYRRGTSVYLCDTVLPMLPEALCDGMCSLVPGEDRYAFSVFMTFDKEGRMTAHRFAKSVIKSKMRFTYEQVMKIIHGGEDKALKLKKPELRTVREIHALAQQLRSARFAAGALDIAIPEMEVVLDAQGEMAGLKAVPYDESHQMIEECMVAANEAVAKELWQKGVKIIARFHDKPDPEKLDLLRAELRGLGVRMGNIENAKVFARFLKEIKSHPLYSTISVMILRSMKRAVYDGAAMGHYGLAKTYYAHFTSPIRRYPDLTLHRQLADYLERTSQNLRPRKVPPKTLAEWSRHLSETEQTAADAERALVEIKKYRLLEDELASRVPIVYEAVIEKCTNFGCFVSVPELAVSGLVHVSNLSNRFLRFNMHDQTLGHFRSGDKLKVVVARVDMRERKIDFMPVQEGKKGGRKKWNSRY